MPEAVVVEGDESEMKCPSCGGQLFDPGDGYPSEGDLLECGRIRKDTLRPCTTNVRITSSDWTLYLEGEVES
jgi:hypothetical protein